MIRAALIGAGSRGMVGYGTYAKRQPGEIEFIAVVEPIEERRKEFARQHGIPESRQYISEDELFAQPKLCEAILICNQDAQHYASAMKAMEKGYHILLEKPMSPNPLETIRIAEEAERRGCLLIVCHVARYDIYFNTVKQLLERNAIGKLMTIQWNENVAFWHQAHSFVRGNWRNSKETSPMILAKCCHDMDMLQWLTNSRCLKVSSFGMLSYFNEKNAPEGSTDRCTDNCKVEHECLYSAIKYYYNEKNDYPQHVVTLHPVLEDRIKALKEGPYGRCVYRCDNDVVDHQVVNMLFENEITVAFTMTAFTHNNCRTFKLMGTRGEIRGNTESGEIEIVYFSGKREQIYPEKVEGGHSGADTMIMRSFVKMVQDHDISAIKTSAMESARSHLIAFAAEHSRLTGQTVELDAYIEELKGKEMAR